MNTLLSPQPPVIPHKSQTQRICTMPTQNNPFSSGRKRRAEGDADEMSISPINSPSTQHRQLGRPHKRPRKTLDVSAGRNLSFPRLLETLDASQMRTILQHVADQHPGIEAEMLANIPRPNASAVISVLRGYYQKLVDALPYGHSNNDYTFDRIRQQLVALCDAISDFTPMFLPPAISQNNVSLEFLDGVTELIHCLIDWENIKHRYYKESAYDQIAKAWALVIEEASRRGGGFTLHSGGWPQKIMNHHERSSGRMGVAVDTLQSTLGWIAGRQGGSGSGNNGSSSALLDQIMSGNVSGLPVSVGQ